MKTVSDFKTLMRDQVLVERDGVSSKLESGLFVPATAMHRIQKNTGTVVAAGEKCDTVKVGDKIMFGSWVTQEFPIEDKTYILMRESQDVLVVF